MRLCGELGTVQPDKQVLIVNHILEIAEPNHLKCGISTHCGYFYPKAPLILGWRYV